MIEGGDNQPNPEDPNQNALRQTVQQEMRAFAADTIHGRPSYSRLVYGQHAAMLMAAEEIVGYTGTDLNTLVRMVDWMVDVYNQAIGFGVMQIRYPKDSTGEDLVYRNTRDKVIEAIKLSMNRPLEPREFSLLRHLFSVICPHDVRAGFFQQFVWSIKYGDQSREGELPGNISQSDFVHYVRSVLPKFENQH